MRPEGFPSLWKNERIRVGIYLVVKDKWQSRRCIAINVANLGKFSSVASWPKKLTA